MLTLKIPYKNPKNTSLTNPINIIKSPIGPFYTRGHEVVWECVASDSTHYKRKVEQPILLLQWHCHVDSAVQVCLGIGGRRNRACAARRGAGCRGWSTDSSTDACLHNSRRLNFGKLDSGGAKISLPRPLFTSRHHQRRLVHETTGSEFGRSFHFLDRAFRAWKP